jgi:hypothetical protein
MDSDRANRRFYARAVFALVEAIVEQHKRLLLELANAGKITLPKRTREVLSEGAPLEPTAETRARRRRYLQLFDKVKEVYKAAAHGFEQELNVSFGDQGWTGFQAAVEIRNRITHPKSLAECRVNSKDMRIIQDGHDWFRSLSNEFVRVAHEHRNRKRW